MKRGISVVALTIGLVGLSLVGEPVKIGVVMNLTGPWASIDGPAWNGIQLAIDQINAAGGILGQPVEAICIDTKADEAETIAAITRLAETEKVSAIMGYCDTHWVLTGAPIAAEYGIPFITPGATHPRIPERTGAWLACFGDNAQAAAMAEYAYKVLGLRKVAVWVDTACDFSVAVCTYFEDTWKHLGGEVVYEDYFETNWTDFSALVSPAQGLPRRGQSGLRLCWRHPGERGPDRETAPRGRGAPPHPGRRRLRYPPPRGGGWPLRRRSALRHSRLPG